MSKVEVKAGGGKLEARFGGRTIKLEVWVNTDEDPHVVADRVAQAAKGPDLRMAVVAGGVLDPEDGAKVWTKMLPLLERERGRIGYT